MKLIDLLVKELPKLGGWPVKVTSIGQDYDRELMFYGIGKPRTGIILDDLAVDHRKCGYQDKGVTKSQYEAAIDKNDGWIEWGGGECPVDGESIVDVKQRDNWTSEGDAAKCWRWNHVGDYADITAYRLHKPDINSRVNDDRLERDLNECIGQEVAPAWNGDGLPPVGTICEALMPALDNTLWRWSTVKVVESGAPGAEKEVLAYDIENTRPAWVDEFRPLRTDAEKAREAAETAMRTCLSGTGAGITPLAAKGIYDAIAAGKIPGVKLEGK